VSGTKRKWYSDVVANWMRARSTAVAATGTVSPRSPLRRRSASRAHG
jgi:hypothetical protein